MIFAFAAITILCLVIAIRADKRSMRLAFLGFALLNAIAGAVAILEGSAFKFLPPDAEPLYRR